MVVGLYAVLSMNVSERRREIGIRIALGGKQADLRRMVLRQALDLVVPGILVGIGGCLAIRRLLAGFLHDVSPSDPITIASVGLLLLLVAVLAALFPAWRAMRIDPSAALRED